MLEASPGIHHPMTEGALAEEGIGQSARFGHADYRLRATALRAAAATLEATRPYFSNSSSGWPDSA